MFKDRVIEYLKYNEYGKLFVDHFRNAQVFRIDENLDDILESKLEFFVSDFGDLVLPYYDSTFIEYPCRVDLEHIYPYGNKHTRFNIKTIGAWLLMNEDAYADDVHWEVDLRSFIEERNGFIKPGEMLTWHINDEGKHYESMPFPLLLSMSKEYYELEDNNAREKMVVDYLRKNEEFLYYVYGLPLQILTLLNDPRIVIEKIIADERRQRKRLLSGKEPACDYHILRINLNAPIVRRIYETTGTQPTVKSILREIRVRSSKRYYADENGHRLLGRFTGWFRFKDHKRGSKDLGQSDKDYKIDW